MNLCAPCPAATSITVTKLLIHRCPFRTEIDEGTVTIGWTTAGATLELHALAAWLGSFAEDVISHEELTANIADHLAGLPGITDVTVSTSWTTADAKVVVRALPGQRLQPPRA